MREKRRWVRGDMRERRRETCLRYQWKEARGCVRVQDEARIWAGGQAVDAKTRRDRRVPGCFLTASQTRERVLYASARDSRSSMSVSIESMMTVVARDGTARAGQRS